MSTTKRKNARRSVLWKGKLEFGEYTFECQIRNISLGGAQVNAGLPLAPGTKFTLHLHQIGEVTGTVAWADDDLLGIQFDVDPKFIREAFGDSAERLGLAEPAKDTKSKKRA